jgi:hypothetical protein
MIAKGRFGYVPDNLDGERKDANAIKSIEMQKKKEAVSKSRSPPKTLPASLVLPPSCACTFCPAIQLLKMCNSRPPNTSIRKGIELPQCDSSSISTRIPFPCQAACKCHEILIRVSTNSLKSILPVPSYPKKTVPHQIAVQIWTPEDRYHMYVWLTPATCWPGWRRCDDHRSSKASRIRSTRKRRGRCDRHRR